MNMGKDENQKKEVLLIESSEKMGSEETRANPVVSSINKMPDPKLAYERHLRRRIPTGGFTIRQVETTPAEAYTLRLFSIFGAIFTAASMLCILFSSAVETTWAKPGYAIKILQGELSGVSSPVASLLKEPFTQTITFAQSKIPLLILAIGFISFLTSLMLFIWAKRGFMRIVAPIIIAGGLAFMGVTSLIEIFQWRNLQNLSSQQVLVVVTPSLLSLLGVLIPLVGTFGLLFFFASGFRGRPTLEAVIVLGVLLFALAAWGMATAPSISTFLHNWTNVKTG